MTILVAALRESVVPSVEMSNAVPVAGPPVPWVCNIEPDVLLPMAELRDVSLNVSSRGRRMAQGDRGELDKALGAQIFGGRWLLCHNGRPVVED